GGAAPAAFRPLGPGAELAAAAVDILPRGIAHLGQHAVAVQVAHDLADAFAFRTLVFVRFQAVVRDQVHHRVLALEQPDDAVHFRLAVIDALEQGPLVLDGITHRAGVALALLD